MSAAKSNNQPDLDLLAAALHSDRNHLQKHLRLTFGGSELSSPVCGLRDTIWYKSVAIFKMGLGSWKQLCLRLLCHGQHHHKVVNASKLAHECNVTKRQGAAYIDIGVVI